MMFVYTPEGADPRRWEFEVRKLMSPEAEAIERHTGMTFERWASAVSEGSMLALHGLLFVLLKRTEPTLKWDAVQFCLDEVDFELSDAEVVESVEALEKKAAEGPLTAPEQGLLDKLRAQVPEIDATLPEWDLGEGSDPFELAPVEAPASSGAGH